MEIRLLELFGGIGSQTQALKNIGIEHTATLCEIDKYAVETYKQLHGKVENLGDITKVNPDNLTENQWNLITYSFPCQSVSIAGKQEGLSKGSGTTSSLLWECEKIIRKVKPKYLLMENVANLLSEKFMPEFEKWLKTLKELGYTNYYQILNAKDYGIPQNRERVFCVSILGKHSYYLFPQPIPLKTRLKDMLEDNAEKKYYLSDKMISFFSTNNEKMKQRGNGFSFVVQKSNEADICNSITTRCGSRMTDTFIEQVNTEETKIKRIGGMYGQTTRWGVYDKDGIAPTITASMGMGGGHIPMIKTDNKRLNETINRNKDKIRDGSFVDSYNKTINNEIAGTITTRVSSSNCTHIIVEKSQKEERLSKQAFETLEENDCKDGDIINPFNKKVVSNGICPTITTRPEGLKTANLVVEHNFKIRKLTPRECFRLMGWTDEQFDRIKGVSNAQLYKQAGNSIVVNVLEAIFRQLFLVDSGLPQKIEYTQEELF